VQIANCQTGIDAIDMMKISVVIPTYNEAQAIAEVIGAVPQNKTQEIIVVDNGSTDGTAEQAAAAGARVIHEPRKGYGSACCSGANAAGNSDIIVFLDGDRSDDPAQLERIAAPVIKGQADLVIGSRIGGRLEKGSMPLHAKLGNRIIVHLLRLLYGVRITDIGSFRAIRTRVLADLHMEQMTYGWPVEMVVKAARKGLRIQSVPIRYRKRIGISKVTGSLHGSVLAAYYMFFVPLKYLFKR
jgi:glycosyltransferase involved in cell wall biosynthesis